MSELKRTPIFPLYKESGAKTVEFGGWDMPVQFSGIIQEHEAVRTKAGLFDVSHMGEFDVRGEDAFSFLQTLVTNDLSRIHPGRAMYTAMCYENGGTVDDLLVYCLGDQHYMVVVNAGNIEKDFDWLQEHTDGFDVALTNQSSEIALLAVQGPLSQEVVQAHVEEDLADISFFRFKELKVAGRTAIVSRTGYTGEDGFELYVDANDAQHLWKTILQSDERIEPCGLGARDTLRLEARLPLYGHELSADISPLEAGIGFAVKTKKHHFIGKDALTQQKENGLSKKVVGLQVLERGIPREGYTVLKDGQEIGHVTSGTMSPTLRIPIALAIVDVAFSELETIVSVRIRNREIPAKVVETPFYKRS